MSNTAHSTNMSSVKKSSKPRKREADDDMSTAKKTRTSHDRELQNYDRSTDLRPLPVPYDVVPQNQVHIALSNLDVHPHFGSHIPAWFPNTDANEMPTSNTIESETISLDLELGILENLPLQHLIQKTFVLLYQLLKIPSLQHLLPETLRSHSPTLAIEPLQDPTEETLHSDVPASETPSLQQLFPETHAPASETPSLQQLLPETHAQTSTMPFPQYPFPGSNAPSTIIPFQQYPFSGTNAPASMTPFEQQPFVMSHATASMTSFQQQPFPMTHATASMTSFQQQPFVMSHATASMTSFQQQPFPMTHATASMTSFQQQPFPMTHTPDSMIPFQHQPFMMAHATASTTSFEQQPFPITHTPNSMTPFQQHPFLGCGPEFNHLQPVPFNFDQGQNAYTPPSISSNSSMYNQQYQEPFDYSTMMNPTSTPESYMYDPTMPVFSDVSSTYFDFGNCATPETATPLEPTLPHNLSRFTETKPKSKKSKTAKVSVEDAPTTPPIQIKSEVDELSNFAEA